MHLGVQAIILSLDYSSIPNVFSKSPSDALCDVHFSSFLQFGTKTFLWRIQERDLG